MNEIIIHTWSTYLECQFDIIRKQSYIFVQTQHVGKEAFKTLVSTFHTDK